jgi:hypothetical protein
VKTIVLLSIVFLVHRVALATPAHPAPASNVAMLVQINTCEACDDIRQVNAAIVIQDIRQRDALAYVPEATTSDFPRAELANMAIIVQENLCIDCMDVKQQNIALVIQNINPRAVAIRRNAAPSAPVLPFPLVPPASPVSSRNTVEITQINTCLDCTEGEQQNIAIVIQNIRPEDCYLYIPKTVNLDAPRAEYDNIANVIQENFCIDCAETVQENLALVIQNINPNDIISVIK